MGTIRTYGEDNSAQGRLTAWAMAWNLAKDRLMGGGFMVALPFVYAIYAPEATTSLVAHSIYFQIMGEHGFIGLFVFLLVGVLTWIDAARLRRTYARDVDMKWAADLGSMMQVSMIGFAVTGAFLSMAYFDLPYNVMAICSLALRIASQEAAKASAARAENSAKSLRPQSSHDLSRYDRAMAHESGSVPR
jgi:probable O-glycosylation ligase (exosortase A-associated)